MNDLLNNADDGVRCIMFRINTTPALMKMRKLFILLSGGAHVILHRWFGSIVN